MEKLKLITVTNSGYQDLTENCLKSLTNNGVSLESVVIYTLDEECYTYFSDKYKDACVKRTQFTHQDAVCYRGEGWKNVTMQKIYAIYSELLINEHIVLFDGDIVFNKAGFLDDLWQRMNENDDTELVVQEEYKGENNRGYMCSGFYLLKSTENTRKIFNITNTTQPNDQEWLNSVKRNIKWKLLPIEKYPNGKFFYDNHRDITPFIVHFNFVLFKQKKGRMKNYGMWLM